MKKNLLYRITPFTGSNYLWNLQELFKRIHIFDGRIIFGIADGEGCDNYGKIENILDTFAPANYETIVVPIEDTLWENTTFIPLLKKLKEDYDPDSITFYGHTKGVTRSLKKHSWKGYEHDLCVHVWAQAMYKYNLDDRYVRVVEKYFKAGKHCVGSFRRIDKFPHFHPDNTWHYSGNFWWVRTAELFRREWTKISNDKFGPEGYLGSLFKVYLGSQFKVEESACIFTDNFKGEPYYADCMKSIGLLP